MPSLCRGMRLVRSNRLRDRETTNGTSEPTCMPGWKHSSSGPGILPTRTEERKRKRPCFRISSRVRRSTANHAHTIRSCCKKEVNKLVRDPCAIASNGARYGLHSPVTSEHLNGEVSAVGVSLGQVTTYSRHGHSARHCACCIAQSAFIILALKCVICVIAETKVWAYWRYRHRCCSWADRHRGSLFHVSFDESRFEVMTGLLTKISPAHIFL